MKGLLAFLCLVGLSLLLGFTTLLFNSWLNRYEPLHIQSILVPQYVPEGAPFSAWVQAFSASEQVFLVQLRLCPEQATSDCVHAARRALRTDGKATLVTATRELPPGKYQLDVLILTDNVLALPRTVYHYSVKVHYE